MEEEEEEEEQKEDEDFMIEVTGCVCCFLYCVCVRDRGIARTCKVASRCGRTHAGGAGCAS